MFLLRVSGTDPVILAASNIGEEIYAFGLVVTQSQNENQVFLKIPLTVTISDLKTQKSIEVH
jgi:hypothetical protein